jgi:hypothetical protein
MSDNYKLEMQLFHFTIPGLFDLVGVESPSFGATLLGESGKWMFGESLIELEWHKLSFEEMRAMTLVEG